MTFEKTLHFTEKDLARSLSHLITIRVEVSEKDRKGEVLSIMGDIVTRDSNNKVISHSAGQCQDTLKKLFPINDKIQRIVEVWDKWHNNDLIPGTPRQMDVLRMAKSNGEDISYDNAIEILKRHDLYEDNDYKYGSKWLFRAVPSVILQEIKTEW